MPILQYIERERDITYSSNLGFRLQLIVLYVRLILGWTCRNLLIIIGIAGHLYCA